jgi:DNA polymerase-3 subunit alpha
VGIYISAHPLDEFSIILNTMCNTHCSELDNKEELTKKEEITMGGIVTGVKSKFTKTGKPCGFVTIEDFEGSGELAFFGEDWGKWRGLLTEGCIVYIKAKCQQKYRDSNFYDFRISDIQYMQTIKANRLEKFTITISSDAIDETVVTDISTMVESAVGKTQLYIQVIDQEHNVSMMLRSKNHSIEIKKDLLNYIDSNPNMSYHVN